MVRKTPSHVNRISLAACAIAMAASSVGQELRADEIRALEKIEKYCIASWRNAGISPQEWSDYTQQAVQSLLERVGRERFPLAMENQQAEERRELNRSIWCVIQRHRRAPKNAALPELYEPQPSAEQQTREAARQQLADVLEIAASQLPERQVRILEMCGQGWSVTDIAEQLDITPARVSDEKYKAVRKLKKHYASLDA